MNETAYTYITSCHLLLHLFTQCLLMPPCIESGYSLLEKQSDGMYAPKYVLDDESNAMAVTFFEESTKENGYEVTVSGSDCGGVVTISEMALVSDAEEPPTEDPPAEDPPADDTTSSAYGVMTSAVGSSVAAFIISALM